MAIVNNHVRYRPPTLKSIHTHTRAYICVCVPVCACVYFYIYIEGDCIVYYLTNCPAWRRLFRVTSLASVTLQCHSGGLSECCQAVDILCLPAGVSVTFRHASPSELNSGVTFNLAPGGSARGSTGRNSGSHFPLLNQWNYTRTSDV